MNKENKNLNNKKLDDIKCDKPDIRAIHPNGCPEEQRKKCHGEKLEKK